MELLTQLVLQSEGGQGEVVWKELNGVGDRYSPGVGQVAAVVAVIVAVNCDVAVGVKRCSRRWSTVACWVFVRPAPIYLMLMLFWLCYSLCYAGLPPFPFSTVIPNSNKIIAWWFQ